MQNNLNIRGEPIQSVYSEYKQGKYIVNRRYQRKLVWTLPEKQKFIDSLLNQYPVPLFLGVILEHSSKGRCFEILDGMQRLDAITSYIDGDFHVGGKYFDLSVVAETNRLLESGKLVQKVPKLDFDLCKTLLNYPLPISTSNYTSNDSVDETFRRINTGGVRLSRQEVRQAGVISDFSQLVRKCAVYIRGDVSHTDVVELDKMRAISLTKEYLGYGINIKDTFWNRNHILTIENILASRDEELVSHVILHILLGSESQTSSKFLDEAYCEGEAVSNKANDAILKYGFDTLYKQFCYTYDELVKVINEFPDDYHTHLYKGKPTKVQGSYQVLFIAFHELLLKQNKVIQNYRALASLLKNAATDCMGALKSDYKWLARDRSRMVKAVCGVINSQFVAREGMDISSQSWVENLENILNQSKTESVCYDFKIGLHPLFGDEGLSQKLISKIVKTLTAMANSHAGENYVILGVADSKEDALKHEKKYDAQPRSYGGFFITGIGHEAMLHHRDIDAYQQKLQQVLESEPVDERTKRLIQRNVVFFKYYDKDVVLLKIIRGESPLKYDGRIYVRKLSNTDPNPIESDKEFEFFKEFMEQTSRYPYN
ncbi:GmrSD restriction endonuclease domain-containing protein [Alteromonas macleodii]|uniref:GmrSD restriction endonuclease domain-containing protein n=1 Tax=Alteromonas macleodii TaxID=28108 RepID=UPI003D01207B